MRIIIEEYLYDYERVAEVLKGLTEVHDADKKVSVSYVGYYFNPELPDCVFILPKVLLEKKGEQELVFGHIDPHDLIDADRCKELTEAERVFIYHLSVWVYRAITVFKEHEYDRKGNRTKQPSIVLHKQAPMMGHTKRRKANTFLDVLLALQQWNKENQQFVMFVTKNMHAGYNKINWTRTIASTPAFVDGKNVVYLNPVNKKRKVNFDEELLVIFYSILEYMRVAYGFSVVMNVNFPVIKGDKFKRYMNDYGKTRLRQIKYKYFSDKSLELWDLCYAFFEKPYQINLNVDQKEYLLVKSFHIVFEAIIDELIAGDQKLPKELLDQEDGKRVDHMFQWQQLTNNDSDDDIYYIGDSKYYKRGNQLGSESIYKQYTYARNVVQWNLDLFNDGDEKDQERHVKLRNDVTEGYNIIPNFFISAHQNELEARDDIHLTNDKIQYHLSRQFENRLFDRDTFMLAHYDVNFLFVLSLYGRNNASSKVEWRNKARKMFRRQIQDMLEKHFLFYAMTAHEDVEPNAYIKEHFQTLLGKVFQPFENRESQQYFSLALRNPDKIELKDKKKELELRAAIRNENDFVMYQLRQSFYVEPCALGENPQNVLPEVQPQPRVSIPKNRLTIHYVENYPETIFLVGGFREDQKQWMFGQQGGKVDDAYNVRLGIDVEGGIKRNNVLKQAKFVLLYEFDRDNEGVFKAFRVKSYQEKTRDDLIKEGYPSPHHDRYYCYIFDEEVNLGTFDIARIISTDRINYSLEIYKSRSITKKYPEGRPIFLKGSELIKYRTGI
ncbi:MAG: restriction endonuclease [Prevotella sp.]|nr:restriction endonuclease [Prevotella sp.]